jgi:hypothetical protein
LAPDPDPNGLGDLLGAPQSPQAPAPPVGPLPPGPVGPTSPLPFLPTPKSGPTGFGGTRLSELNSADPKQHLQSRKQVSGEWVNDYVTALNAIKPASANLDAHAQDWQTLQDRVVESRDAFRHWLEGTASDPGGWRGSTATAIVEKATQSLTKLDELASAASVMGIVTQAFAGAITGTRDLIAGREQEYLDQVVNCSQGSTPETRRDKENELNVFAQQVIRDLYNPTIEDIGGKHPTLSAAVPTAGIPGGGPGSAGLGRGGGGGGAGGIKPGGLGTPALPGLGGPGGPTDPAADQQGPPTMPSGSPQGGGDPAGGAGDAAKNAAGQAGNAASQAMGKAGQQNPAGRLPEGVLGLGPKGLKGAVKTGGAGGARGAGGAGAAQTRGPATKPGAQLAPTSKAVTSVPTSRAGVSSTGAAGGAGTPAAGHRGGAAGKEHKVNKALRHAKHGQEVVGDAEAVLPVIGDEPKDAVPAEQGRRT